MRVAILTSEAVPFAKTGGLADVSGALPKALVEQDVDAKHDRCGILEQRLRAFDDTGLKGMLLLIASKAKFLLGWRPQYASLERIIQSAWDWQSKHVQGYNSRA